MEAAHSSMSSGAAFGAWTPPTDAARRYTLLRRLAVGGMGELLLARAAAPGGVQKLVAIKRVRAEYASDPTFVSMFLNEARLAATLDHPNVVRTYDLVEDGGSFFMVMEYLHGQSLGRILNAVVQAGRSLPLQHCVTIGLGVAAGLHCAHERRGVDGRPLDIVHRDLSPGNVFVTYEGGVKLLDFGIAKATSRTSITLGPARKGKVSYMSPEQCVGDDVDRRSDIFSLGIVMWETSTGQRLFRGDNEFGIMNQITTMDAPSPRKYAPELPEEWCRIIEKALQRDRDARWQTAMDFHEALEAFAQAKGLLPSSAALGKFVEEYCGREELPSAEPTPEFAQAQGNTLVVPANVPEAKSSRGPGKLSLVLALAAGAIGGAIAVGASSSDPPPVEPAVVPIPAAAPAEPQPEPVTDEEEEMPAATSAKPEVAEPPSPPPTPDQAETPSKKRKQPRRTRKSSRRPAKTAPTKPVADAEDKAVRGLDGLLPRG